MRCDQPIELLLNGCFCCIAAVVFNLVFVSSVVHMPYSGYIYGFDFYNVAWI